MFPENTGQTAKQEVTAEEERVETDRGLHRNRV